MGNKKSNNSKENIKNLTERTNKETNNSNELSAPIGEKLKLNDTSSANYTTLNKLSSFEELIAKYKERLLAIEQELLYQDLAEEEKNKMLEETKSINEELKMLEKEINHTINKDLQKARKELFRLNEEKKYLQAEYDFAISKNARNWEKDLKEYMKKNK